MSDIRFSLVQIDAFATVCECGTLTAAARRLRKDRTTISELVDNLEADLGFLLFDRGSRPLLMTEAGERFYRQARLLLHEAWALSQVAEQIPRRVATSLTLCYDPFVPRKLLTALIEKAEARDIHLDLIVCERMPAQQMLEEGTADLGLYQAINRPVSERYQWRAIGSLELAVYAREGYFSDSPVSFLVLASAVQLMPCVDLKSPLASRLQIADRVRRVTELAMLRELLCSGTGWAFLPIHLEAGSWPGIVQVEPEFGVEGLAHPLVALWIPGKTANPVLAEVLDMLTDYRP